MQRDGMDGAWFDRRRPRLKNWLTTRPDVLITDIRMPGMDGLEFSRQIADMNIDLPMIVITAHTDLDSAVAAYQSGAFEYLPKPFDVDDAVSLLTVRPKPVAARKAGGQGEARASACPG